MKITVKKLEDRFMKRIPKKFKVNLKKYIDISYVQEILNRAWDYSLTDKDNKEVFDKGRQTSTEYPGLYYIAFIYIHPLTIAHGILDKVDRMKERIR